MQSDVTQPSASLFVRNPGWHAVFDMDGARRSRPAASSTTWLAADKMLIAGLPLPVPGAGYIEKDGSGYRLVPVAWNPVV